MEALLLVVLEYSHFLNVSSFYASTLEHTSYIVHYDSKLAVSPPGSGDHTMSKVSHGNRQCIKICLYLCRISSSSYADGSLLLLLNIQ